MISRLLSTSHLIVDEIHLSHPDAIPGPQPHPPGIVPQALPVDGGSIGRIQVLGKQAPSFLPEAQVLTGHTVEAEGVTWYKIEDGNWAQGQYLEIGP